MTQFTFKRALAMVALVGTLAVTVLPQSVRAASSAQQRYADGQPQTEVNGRAVIYHDAFSGASGYLADQRLGIKTHWEGYVNLSNPSSPIEWTRVEDKVSAAASSTAFGVSSSEIRPSSIFQGGVRTRPRDLTPTTCNNPGGAKLWYYADETGG